MLSRGADPLAQDCKGATALHRACLAHQEAVVQLLLDRPHTITALIQADSAGLGTLVNLADNEGRTPLHLAARNGLVSATQLLIQNGADVTAKDRFGKGISFAVNKSTAIDCGHISNGNKNIPQIIVYPIIITPCNSLHASCTLANPLSYFLTYYLLQCQRWIITSRYFCKTIIVFLFENN